MLDKIYQWGINQGLSPALSESLSQAVAVFALVVISIILLKLSHVLINSIGTRLVGISKNEWDDVLVEKRFFSNLAHLVPITFLSFLIPEAFASNQNWVNNLDKAVELYLIVMFFLISNSLIGTFAQVYKNIGLDSRVPLSGVFQIVKLTVFVIAALLFISTLLDKSPTYLLSGLGALTAILLLVFKDTLQGLTAGIQVAINRMLAHGDWIEMPSQNVDGVVMDVGLNTVQVRNWDNTISYLPTYTLITEPFKNWRGMEESDGRRFKRRLVIDPGSVKLSSDNSEQETNLAEFRQWVSEYLAQHSQVNQKLTRLVRVVNPDEYGVHLEIYFFILDKRWVEFESIAASIYETLLANMARFDLKTNSVCLPTASQV